MSENVQEKQKSSKLVIILLIVLIVLLVAGIIIGIVLFGKRSNDDSSADGEEPVVTIGYEGAGVVALGEDEFQKTMEEMIKQAEDGLMDLRYKNIAESTDGVHFDCMIGNSENNIYDMYFNIYLNTDLEQQILLTGLVPPGEMIETFESEIPLEPGEHEATLVFTQVKDDHATICGQVMVVLRLEVSE
ncbi:MAG: hypothetical protein HDT25_03605 [Ruminococcus sp.]|nr:hypothetical protein [Ruminococcus sp.]